MNFTPQQAQAYGVSAEDVSAAKEKLMPKAVEAPLQFKPQAKIKKINPKAATIPAIDQLVPPTLASGGLVDHAMRMLSGLRNQ